VQGALLEVATLRRAFLASLLAVAALTVPLPALAAEAAMTVDVLAGKWKALRLKSLPKDASLAVAVQSASSIGISLLKEEDFKRFPQPQEPVFMGASDRSLSFSVTIPETGNYYLVFDNRRSVETQKVKFVVRAERGAARGAPQAPGPSPAPRSGRGQHEF
jgi:uncharacterized protein YfaA (DUF2138 family)